MFSASAPATLMLLGEHGVLRGGHALLATADKRIYAELTPNNDARIVLESNLGRYETSIDALKIEKPFTFVLAVIQNFKNHLSNGFSLKITSDFSETIGFGSSAAVTIATQSVLCQMLNLEFSASAFVEHALKAVEAVQGKGRASGADLAASYYGGIVRYCRQDFVFERLADGLPLVALYSGLKVPTAEVIGHVNKQNIADAIFKEQNEQVLKACAMLNDLPKFGSLLNDAQKFHEQHFKTLTPALDGCTERLRALPGIHGAKISGSGLGDCVIGLGEAEGDGIMPLKPAQFGLI